MKERLNQDALDGLPMRDVVVDGRLWGFATLALYRSSLVVR